MKKADLIRDRAILTEFLKTWSLERVEKMTIDEFVSLEDKTTFCQFVETKTKDLGSIKGWPGSIKFGIYKRGDESKRPKGAQSDDTHSWLPEYGEIKNEAFDNIKKDIIKIIISAQNHDLNEIDDIPLNNMFKWKVAFLYSDESFIPIYKKEALHIIAKDLGLTVDNDTKYSEINHFIAKTKPIGISVYDYMRKLYSDYRIEQKTDKDDNTSKRKKLKGTDKRNTKSQNRKGTREYVAEQFHNELQERLETHLKKKFGLSNVILEENYVDVKVTLDKEIQYYKVKTAGFAEDCIRQGLGQLLSYVHYENDKRDRRLIIFGKNRTTKSEIGFIDFVKAQLGKTTFEYLSLEDIENK